MYETQDARVLEVVVVVVNFSALICDKSICIFASSSVDVAASTRGIGSVMVTRASASIPPITPFLNVFVFMIYIFFNNL